MQISKRLLAGILFFSIAFSLTSCRTSGLEISSQTGSFSETLSGSDNKNQASRSASSSKPENAQVSSEVESAFETSSHFENIDKKNKATTSAVLSGLFNAPDKDLTAALLAKTSELGLGVSEVSAPQENSAVQETPVIKDKFGSYFTEKELGQFVIYYLCMYQGFAQTSKSTLKLKDFTFTKTNEGYDFIAAVQCAKGEENKTAKVDGDLQFLNDGKIVSFRIRSDDGLLGQLMNGKQ